MTGAEFIGLICFALWAFLALALYVAIEQYIEYRKEDAERYSDYQNERDRE